MKMAKGDKHSVGSAAELGLSEIEKGEGTKMPLRGDTGQANGMRPTSKTTKVKDKRGSFKIR